MRGFPDTFVCLPYKMLLPVVLRKDNQARALKTFMVYHDTTIKCTILYSFYRCNAQWGANPREPARRQGDHNMS
jgi:hypothetical protein